MSTEPIILRAFRAVDDPERCARYVSEHTRVLEDIRVFNVLKPDTSWCNDPNVVVLVAEHPALGMVAGIRVHKAAFGVELPMQRSVASLDRSIAGRLAELLPDGNAEIAGLWNAHRFSGRGIPMLLMEAAVAVASQIGVRSLVTFIAEYVAPYAARTGFVMMSSLKHGGDFVYPVPGIRTHAMILPDLLTMVAANPGDRQRILSLRLRPYQLRTECPKQKTIEVRYELLDPSPCTDEVAGRNLHAA